MSHKTYYKRKLPHIQPKEGTYFITYRLYGSIPMSVIKSIQDSYDFEIKILEQEFSQNQNFKQLSPELQHQIKTVFDKKKYDLGKISFKKYDEYLDNNLNKPYWLKNPEIAKINMDALHFHNDKSYKLHAATIMSNHIHVMFTLLPKAPPLWKVMQSIKGFTGRQSNKILDRVGEGNFWEEESYDRWVRSKEFEKIFWYILNNPVKAKLVKNWKDWEWSYCDPYSEALASEL